MKATTLARIDHFLRPLATSLLPSSAVSKLYSRGRDSFLASFSTDVPPRFIPPASAEVSLWGLTLQNSIGNAAGMFKNGEAYDVVAAQGAGMYMAGTTTGAPRSGNSKGSHRLPFMPYPSSAAASNWLGLPNKGHIAIAQKISSLDRIAGVPVAVSVMRDPGMEYTEAMKLLADGLRAYGEARVDIIEINESCPNAGHGASDWNDTVGRLRELAEMRSHTGVSSIPMVVKISPDTTDEAVSEMVAELIQLGFDGINIGNTSTQYENIKQFIRPRERALFSWFTQNFGGGVSGEPLRLRSLELASAAVRAAQQQQGQHEFHVIRTGGISSAEDIIASQHAGVSFNQWYTGYFEAFGLVGHDVYKQLSRALQEM